MNLNRCPKLLDQFTLRARWCVAGELSDSGIYGLLLEPPVA
ncbi:N-acetyltransferase GCN5 [Pseudomonas putida]|nr:N-acetyltransferase GCN5 [Pseudomonas putida]